MVLQSKYHKNTLIIDFVSFFVENLVDEIELLVEFYPKTITQFLI